METESKTLHRATVEGYRVLLRARAQLVLPCGFEKISEFYRSLAQKCIEWATEVSGEGVRAEYLALSSPFERAKFPLCTYSFSMRCEEFASEYVVAVCESTFLRAGESRRYKRLSHVWLLAEETLLPVSQILRLLNLARMPRELGFSPDGIYPEGDVAVFFKNATAKNAFTEKRCAFGGDNNL